MIIQFILTLIYLFLQWVLQWTFPEPLQTLFYQGAQALLTLSGYLGMFPFIPWSAFLTVLLGLISLIVALLVFKWGLILFSALLGVVRK